MQVRINEIFRSFQGEGSKMGRECVFVRFQGCEAHCTFCDSASTWSPEHCALMSVSDIIATVARLSNYQPLPVCITGGEPTEQWEGLKELCEQLDSEGHDVWLESNGHTEHEYDELRASFVVVSPKRAYDFEYQKQGVDELKYVVDEDFDENVVPKNPCVSTVWLQPCDGPYLHKSMERIMRLVNEYPERFRAGIQLHKIYKVR